MSEASTISDILLWYSLRLLNHIVPRSIVIAGILYQPELRLLLDTRFQRDITAFTDPRVLSISEARNSTRRRVDVVWTEAGHMLAK